MSWTFDATLSTDRDKVRLLIGDTDTNNQQLTDEAIAYLLEREPRVEFAAARACQVMEARYARYDSDQSGQIIARYRALAIELRKTGQMGVSQPYAGGISESDISSVNSDTDRPDNYFKVGMHDNQGTIGTRQETER
jgi:hypothetical protein